MVIEVMADIEMKNLQKAYNVLSVNQIFSFQVV